MARSPEALPNTEQDIAIGTRAVGQGCGVETVGFIFGADLAEVSGRRPRLSKGPGPAAWLEA